MHAAAALQEKQAHNAAPRVLDLNSLHQHEGMLDVHMRRALDRMRRWCERNPFGQAILARGFVVDSTAEFTQKIIDYFAGVDVAPIIDDITLFITQNAKETGQRFQQVKFHYVNDGKPPRIEDANIKTALRAYTENAALGSDFTRMNKELKMAGGGSSGDANQMLAQITMGNVKFFLLEVGALDIADEKSRDLLADLPIVQAFGASPAAVVAAVETVAAGGADAKKLIAVAEQVVEVKALRATLAAMPEAASAAPVAAALAIKAEVLADTLSTLKAPAAVKADITRTIDTLKVDLGARQVESAITAIARALPAQIVGRAANLNTPVMPAAPAATVNAPTSAQPASAQPVSTPAVSTPAAPANTAPTITTTQISRAVEAVQHIARTEGIPVRDVIAMTMTNTAPPSVAAPVATLTTLMAQPSFLPTLERSLPPAVAAPVHAALTTPPVQLAAQTPVQPAAVINNVHALAQATELPSLRMAVAALDVATQPIAVEAVAPALRAPALQNVADNIQAAAISQMTPEAAKPALAIAAAQVEALAVQAARTPEAAPPQPQLQQQGPQQQPQQPLPPEAPMAKLAAALDIKAPEMVPPAPPVPAPAVPVQAAPPVAQPQTTPQTQTAPQAQPAAQPDAQPATQPVTHQAPSASPVTFTPVQTAPTQTAPTQVTPNTAQPVQQAQPQTPQQAAEQPATGGGYKTYNYAPDQAQGGFTQPAANTGGVAAPAGSANVGTSFGMPANTGGTTAFGGTLNGDFFTPGRNGGATASGTTANAADKKATGPGCNGKVCAACFNQTCKGGSPKADNDLNSNINHAVFSQFDTSKPRVA